MRHKVIKTFKGNVEKLLDIFGTFDEMILKSLKLLDGEKLWKRLKKEEPVLIN